MKSEFVDFIVWLYCPCTREGVSAMDDCCDETTNCCESGCC
jgi:hypothetical protein